MVLEACLNNNKRTTLPTNRFPWNRQSHPQESELTTLPPSKLSYITQLDGAWSIEYVKDVLTKIVNSNLDQSDQELCLLINMLRVWLLPCSNNNQQCEISFRSGSGDSKWNTVTLTINDQIIFTGLFETEATHLIIARIKNIYTNKGAIKVMLNGIVAYYEMQTIVKEALVNLNMNINYYNRSILAQFRTIDIFIDFYSAQHEISGRLPADKLLQLDNLIKSTCNIILDHRLLPKETLVIQYKFLVAGLLTNSRIPLWYKQCIMLYIVGSFQDISDVVKNEQNKSQPEEPDSLAIMEVQDLCSKLNPQESLASILSLLNPYLATSANVLLFLTILNRSFNSNDSIKSPFERKELKSSPIALNFAGKHYAELGNQKPRASRCYEESSRTGYLPALLALTELTNRRANNPESSSWADSIKFVCDTYGIASLAWQYECANDRKAGQLAKLAVKLGVYDAQLFYILAHHHWLNKNIKNTVVCFQYMIRQLPYENRKKYVDSFMGQLTDEDKKGFAKQIAAVIGKLYSITYSDVLKYDGFNTSDDNVVPQETNQTSQQNNPKIKILGTEGDSILGESYNNSTLCVLVENRPNQSLTQMSYTLYSLNAIVGYLESGKLYHLTDQEYPLCFGDVQNFDKNLLEFVD